MSIIPIILILILLYLIYKVIGEYMIMRKEKQEERSYEYKCSHPDNPEWREK